MISKFNEHILEIEKKTQRRRHVKMEAEIGVVLSQVSKH